MLFQLFVSAASGGVTNESGESRCTLAELAAEPPPPRHVTPPDKTNTVQIIGIMSIVLQAGTFQIRRQTAISTCAINHTGTVRCHAFQMTDITPT